MAINKKLIENLVRDELAQRSALKNVSKLQLENLTRQVFEGMFAEAPEDEEPGDPAEEPVEPEDSQLDPDADPESGSPDDEGDPDDGVPPRGPSKFSNFIHKLKTLSLEKGGRLFFGKEEYKRNVTRQLQKTLDKASNQMVRDAFEMIEKEFPGFPNNSDHRDFKLAAESIASVYDSLAFSVEDFRPGEERQVEGAMNPVVANGLVDALREWVKVVLDRDLGDYYKHFIKEEIDRLIEEGILVESESGILTLSERALNEGFVAERWKKEYHGLLEEPEDELEADPDEPEEAPPQDSDQDHIKGREEAETIKWLKSKRLPILLGLLGSASIAAHNLLPGLTTLVPSAPDWPDAPEEEKPFVEDIIHNDINVSTRGHGLMYLINKAADGTGNMDVVGNLDKIAGDTGKTVEEVIASLAEGEKAVGKKGEATAKAVQHLYDYVSGGHGTAGDFVRRGMPDAKFIEYVKGVDPGFAEQVAVENAGTGFPGDNSLLGINVTNWKIAAMKAAAGASKAWKAARVAKLSGQAMSATGSMAALGGIFLPIGIAAITAGALVAMVRKKGLKSSRAQILNDLWVSFKDFDLPEDVQPEFTPPATPEEVPPIIEETPPNPVRPEINEPIGVPPEAPTPTEDLPEINTQSDYVPLALARLDDTGIKVHKSNHRNNKKTADAHRKLFKAAQKQGVVGKGDLGNPVSSADLYAKFGEKPRPGAPINLSFEEIEKVVHGRSRHKDKFEVYYSVDGSFVTDVSAVLKKAGIKKDSANIALMLGRRLVNHFARQRKKMTVKGVRNNIKRIIGKNADISPEGVKDIMKAIAQYGLLESTATVEKPKRTRRKAATVEPAGTPTAASEIKETLDRWSALAGIIKGGK